MPELRRTIRRLSPDEVHLADEPWWPVFLALLVFAGFASGTVLAYLSFEADRWYANAATWLIAIGAVVLVSFVATLFLPPRAVRRSLQLAIVLNVLFHFLLLVASLELDVFGVPYKGSRPSTLRSPRREAKVVPDYPSVRINNLRERIRDNEQPVDTETPVEASEITPDTPTAETKEVSEEPTPNIPLPSTPDAAAEATSLPKTPSTRRADTMAESGPAEAQSVRFSESSSLMSRREVEQPDKKVARPVEVIPDPGQAPSAVAKTELTARETDVARSEALTAPSPAATAPETTLPKATDSPRASESAAPSEAIANASSAERQPTAERSVDASVDSSAKAMARSASELGTESLAAQSTSTAQSASSEMPGQREVTSPSSGVAESSTRASAAKATASELPQSENVASSGNLRRSSETASPSVAMAAPESSRLTGGAEATELSAAPTSSLAQQSGRESAGQLASQSVSEALSGGAELRAATQSRANRNSTSAPAETAMGDASLPRAAMAANSARSPVNAEVTDVAGSGTAATGEPTTPTQTTITQAQTGIAGGASGPNLDRSAPAGSSPALLPSGMARRDSTAQASTPGEAFESSSSAVVRRSQTGAASPSTTIRAENTPFAATQGSDRVGELNATSSAALTQASSQAGSAANAMSQGTLEVDLGPTQIVAERGEGKGSGGGGPQISDRSFDTTARPGFAAARSPGYVPSSIKADAAAGSTSPAESLGSQGIGPSAASLEASQLGGSGNQSLSSLAGREAPSSPNAAGELSSMAPGSKVGGGDSPAPSNMAEGSAGSPSSRRSTSTIPSLAGVKADEVGGGNSAGTSNDAPGLSAEKFAGGARAAEGTSGPGMRSAAVSTSESALASGGGSNGRASSSDATPSGPVIGTGPSLATRGDSKAAPSVGLVADDVEAARNLPSAGTNDPGQGLALAPTAGKGSDVTRQGNESLPALLSAPDGVGGLGTSAGPDAGINRATALRDSLIVDDSAVRLSRNVGALAPTTVASSGVPKEAFQSRGERLAGSTKAPAGGSSGAPSPETEEAIERGLAFLASIQQADGRWSLAMPGERVSVASDTAATALALLSFQGAGYTHREHKYKDRVAAGLLFLVRNQHRNGDLFMLEDENSNGKTALYSHAIASLALCEAYGMTQDPLLKEPAERALLFILASQSTQRGGWRYVPQVSTDTSVSGWMLMALKSGQLSGIKVPDSAYNGVRKWLDLAAARDSNGSKYVYNAFANDQEQANGRIPTESMTAVGLLMRFYTGWNRDHASMVAGANYLRQNPPAVSNRDTYYWYYGTQVMFHMGGKYWEDWNRALHPMLLESQIKQGQLGGSWDPAYPVQDKWASHGGRLYVTTMNLLSLEVYYRHLPLYEETSK